MIPCHTAHQERLGHCSFRTSNFFITLIPEKSVSQNPTQSPRREISQAEAQVITSLVSKINHRAQTNYTTKALSPSHTIPHLRVVDPEAILFSWKSHLLFLYLRIFTLRHTKAIKNSGKDLAPPPPPPTPTPTQDQLGPNKTPKVQTLGLSHIL